MTIQQRNSNRFHPRAYHLPNHGLLTRITVQSVEFHAMEQASYLTRKHDRRVKNVKKRMMVQNGVKCTSCLDMVIELTNSQLQWLPAHTCTISIQSKFWHSWGGVFQAQPLVKNYWQLMAAGGGRSIHLFKCVATGRFFFS